MASKFAAAHQAGMYAERNAAKIAVWKRKGVKVPAKRLAGAKKPTKTKSPKLAGAGKKAKPKAGRKAK